MLFRSGKIDEAVFKQLSDYLPQGSMLVYNNTRVIQARMLFQKETGAQIEVFCLEPVIPHDYALVFQQTESCSWLCLVGNLKKWKEGALHKTIRMDDKEVVLSAERIKTTGDSHLVRFSWNNPQVTFAELLDADVITISVASEICRYGEDVQREVYEKYLKEGIQHYSSWRGRKAKEIAELIEQKFTIDLERYYFDKTECASCRYNTNNLLLFNDGGCGQCSNRTCLAEMNAAFLKEKAIQIAQQQPDIILCRDPYCTNATTVERLIASGYDVETINSCIAFPKNPIEPQIGDYDNSEDYEEALKDYEEEQADYMEICNEISRQGEAGEITLYAKIGQADITLCYVEKTATQIAESNKVTQTIATQIAKLEKKDKRNKEIATENTVDDVKRVIKEIDTTETKFGADEDRMMYFFLLSSLRKENYAAVGIDKECDYLKDEEKMNVIANLTAKAKAVIRRDFLIANFKDAFRNNGTAALLLDFAKKHMPEELANITNKYNEVYENRHKRIEEKKVALLEQTKETEQPQSEEVLQPTEEQQPEVAA